MTAAARHANNLVAKWWRRQRAGRGDGGTQTTEAREVMKTSLRSFALVAAAKA